MVMNGFELWFQGGFKVCLKTPKKVGQGLDKNSRTDFWTYTC